YSFGFIPIIGSAVKGVGGLYDRLGLRTFINLRAGLYNADTDYDGRFASGSFTSKLSNSTDDLAFFGTVSLETRKQIGPRTSLSLWTDYEYISSVPKIHYADDNPDAHRRRRNLRQPHHAEAEYRPRLAAALHEPLTTFSLMVSGIDVRRAARAFKLATATRLVRDAMVRLPTLARRSTASVASLIEYEGASAKE